MRTIAQAGVAGAIANLLGQAMGNYLNKNDIFDPCNYDFWSAAGSGLEGSAYPHLRNVASYVNPYTSGGFSRAPQNATLSILRGGAMGGGTLGGQYLGDIYAAREGNK